ncbi:unnamed protein product [Spirodela intermedia]|uniref:Uncharacterized protein n=1 Tax=Spirodela intermedia TaxID=51605 RepID=A0A7I8JAX9_SPIIN|nr:unnamed protein product [Spirodela intermedia]CAA6666885.1 unnamed protein product [Spirodela intermedia]
MELFFTETLRSQPSWVLLISSVGAAITIKFSFSVLHWLYVVFLRPSKNLLDYGQWALVTGSTDGIGKALAFELARRGLNLVLVGRNSDKLSQVAGAIQDETPTVVVETVVVDFTGDLSGGIRRLESAIRGLDVGVLVNNAGLTYDHGTFFHEDLEVWMRILKVNLEGLTAVTSVVLPAMLFRKRGAVVNIGSGSAMVIPSHPLFSVYAATKAYVHSISRSLRIEYKKSGIDVQCQIPLYVATNMVSFKKASFFTSSPTEFARSAVTRIGYEPQCMPYWPHTLQSCGAKLIPDRLMNKWRLAYGLSRRRQKDSS